MQRTSLLFSGLLAAVNRRPLPNMKRAHCSGAYIYNIHCADNTRAYTRAHTRFTHINCNGNVTVLKNRLQCNLSGRSRLYRRCLHTITIIIITIFSPGPVTAAVNEGPDVVIQGGPTACIFPMEISP